jgi:hypothetical protein
MFDWVFWQMVLMHSQNRTAPSRRKMRRIEGVRADCPVAVEFRIVPLSIPQSYPERQLCECSNPTQCVLVDRTVLRSPADQCAQQTMDKELPTCWIDPDAIIAALTEPRQARANGDGHLGASSRGGGGLVTMPLSIKMSALRLHTRCASSCTRANVPVQRSRVVAETLPLAQQ